MKGKRLSAMAMAAMLGVLLVPSSAYAANADWTAGNPLIAHALGEYDGKIETNSQEAFISSWENGYRVMEADFIYRLEIEPGSNLVMDSNTFQNKKIIYEQTPMTAVDLMYLMTTYTDVYLVTDTKDTDKATVQKQFQDLKNIANNIGHPEILDRIIPQIYNEEMLGWIKEIYDFPQWIYTLYLQTNVDYAKTADFCAKNGIGVVTIEKSRLNQSIVDTFQAKDVQVYAHTVNRYLQFEDLLAMGVSGIYTDSIKPYKLSVEPVNMGSNNYTLHTMDIMGTKYVKLRDYAAMMSANGGFSAQFDAATNTLALKNSGTFTTLGNELLLKESDRLITKKATNKLTYNDAEVTLTGYTIDGDLYYPLQGMLDLTGHALETKDGVTTVTKAAKAEK